MPTAYIYKLKYKDGEFQEFTDLKKCLPFIENIVKHNFITRDVLNDYLTKGRPRHQIYFQDWTINREKRMKQKHHHCQVLVSSN